MFSICRPEVIRTLYRCDDLSIFREAAAAGADDAPPPMLPPHFFAKYAEDTLTGDAVDAEAAPRAPDKPVNALLALAFASEQAARGGILHRSVGS